MTRHANCGGAGGYARGAPSAPARTRERGVDAKAFDRATPRREEGPRTAAIQRGRRRGVNGATRAGGGPPPARRRTRVSERPRHRRRRRGRETRRRSGAGDGPRGGPAGRSPARQAPPEALAACVEFLPRLVTFLDVDDDASAAHDGGDGSVAGPDAGHTTRSPSSWVRSPTPSPRRCSRATPSPRVSACSIATRSTTFCTTTSSR